MLKLKKDKSAAGLGEYALLAALIAGVSAVAVTALGLSNRGNYEDLTVAVSTPITQPPAPGGAEPPPPPPPPPPAGPTPGPNFAIVLGASSLPAAQASQPWTFDFSSLATFVDAGTVMVADLSWAPGSPALPSWMTLDPDTGVATASSPQTGTTSFQITASFGAFSESRTFELVVAPPPPWTPAAISGQVRAWFDADNLASITIDGNGRVAQWTDLRGNATLTNSTTAQRPIRVQRAALGNRSVIRFDGGQKLIGPDGFAEPGAFAMFAVYSTNVNAGRQTIAVVPHSPVGANGRELTHVNLRANTFSASIRALNNNAQFTAPQWTRTNTTSHQIMGFETTGQSQHASTGSSIALNATTQSLTPGVIEGYTSVVDVFAIGSRMQNDTYLNGDVAELIVLDDVPSADVRARIEGYLAHRWGLQALLPSAHPYRNNPPTL